ncbi:uncharacterized protein CEXT_73421 [Caerostris extrusa]|uniref:LolA-like domain-containing protein n=1 Tax=Caerostris extrusa TaxID=172846 RepID=A0AAV4XJN4_CAEEX|nr:uncharacterized protein CEXT_73421 [Caerostris extrusa]
MAGQRLLVNFLVLFLLWAVDGQALEGPPVVAGSYRANGEMVEILEDGSGILTQVAFEETYDVDRQLAAFRVWLIGKNLTFIENFKTNQTFQFNGTDCTLETVEEWIKTKSPPSLLNYEDTNGTVRFSLKQLFAMDSKYLKEARVPSTFRGVPALKWMYEIKGTDKDTKRSTLLNVYAYWSDGTWSTSSSQKFIPLGYIVTRMNFTKGDPKFKVHEQFINVFSFGVNITDPKLFEPIQGVQCVNRKQTLQFPDVSNIQAISLHSEVILPDNLEIRYVDTWLDTKSKILRVDLERIDEEVPVFEEKARKYQSEIAIQKLGIVYVVTYNKGLFSCKVVPFKDYAYDTQTLFNIKLPEKEWQTAKLFGLNQTSYVYIGKTVKRDIPCHMFQGLRKDWPDPSSNVESLWEWCFSENMTKKQDSVTFRNGEYGLIHAQLKILKSGDQMFYPGLKMIHHFYDVNRKDPAVLYATHFDIQRCFGQGEKRDLQFLVDWQISDDNLHLVENATSDTTFLRKWKDAIYRFSGLEPYSLRVTKVQAVRRTPPFTFPPRAIFKTNVQIILGWLSGVGYQA